jgi:hypothetical protein
MWRSQWVAVVVGYDDDEMKVDDSDKECVVATGRSVKHQAWPPIDHFERLLEKACSNHAYLIKHRLKDCGMTKSFMTSGSFTRDREPEEDPGGIGVTPFPREDAVVTFYNGCPPPRRHRVSNLSLRTSTRCG